MKTLKKTLGDDIVMLLSSKYLLRKLISDKTYNHFHNILRLFDVLLNFPLTASETMHDYYS